MCTGMARPNDDIVLTGSRSVDRRCAQACIVERPGNVLNMEAIIKFVPKLVEIVLDVEPVVELVVLCLSVAGLNL